MLVPVHAVGLLEVFGPVYSIYYNEFFGELSYQKYTLRDVVLYQLANHFPNRSLDAYPQLE